MSNSIDEKAAFRKLQEATNTGWWSANISKRTLKISSYIAHVLGVDSEEISFETFKQLIHPDTLKYSYAKIRNLLLYPGNIEEEVIIKTTSGYQALYIKHTDISVNEKGETLTEGYMQFLKNRSIVSKKNSKQDFLNKLYQNMPLGYYRLRIATDSEGKVVDFEYLDANEKLLEMVQLRREDLIGKMYSEIGHFFVSNVNIQLLADVAFHGKVFKEQVLFKTNKRYYENTLFSPMVNDVVVLFADITDIRNTSETLRKSKQKLQKIYENIPIGIEMYDKDGYMMSANEKAATIQGLPPDANVLIGLNLFEHPFLPKDAYDRLKAGEDAIFDIRTDRQITHQYYGAPSKEYYRYLTINCTVLHNKDGEVDGYLVIVIDNTEFYEINDSLKKAKLKAEEADRLKSQFLSNMSHEIRTPLNAIVGFSDMLLYTDDKEERESYGNIIKRNNDLLLQLINDILDLSRIESNRMEFIYTHVDINQMINSLVASSNVKIEVPDLKVVSNLTAEKLVIRTEENRIHQVLSNFVNNAIKFTPKGKIEIGYRIREEDIYFYVSDTGKGIPEDKLSDVFRRFVKLNEFDTGTGLGLSICRTIIQRLHGEVGADSEEGKGSTFWFTLPVKPVVD